MAATIDHLITKFSLDAGQYKSEAKSLAETTRSTFGIVANLGKTMLFGGGAIGGGLMGMAVYAIKTAMSFDVMQRSIATVTGSVQRASEVMKFAQNLAGPSAFFDTKQLAQAAAMLETFSMKTERFLPLASTMASLFGQDSQSLMEFTYALGRIKSGVFGEGFERMREFGISMQDLMAEGLKFSSGNTFQGTAEQALNAIEAVVKRKFGTLDAVMQDSPMAKWTSLLDAVERAAKNAGDAMLKYIAPVLDRVQQGISAIAGDQRLFGFIDALFKGFNPDQFGNTILYGIASIIAAVKQIPGIVKGAFDSFYSAAHGVSGILDAIKATLYIIVGVAIVKSIIALAQAYKVLATAIQATAAAQAVVTSMAPGGIALVAAAVGAGVGIYWWLSSMINKAFAGSGKIAGFDAEQYNKDRDSIYKQMTAGATQQDNADGGNGGSAKPETASPSNRYLRQIAQNTNRLVEMQRTILGGGEVGRLGATPVELGRIHGRGGKIAHGVALIMAGMDEQAGLTIRGANRSRLAMS